MRLPALLAVPALLALAACNAPYRREVESYLRDYAQTYQRLSYASQQAEWASNTRIVAGDSSNAVRTKAANERLARFVGSVANIDRIRGYLGKRERLTPLQGRQLEKMLYMAANSPMTVADVVRQRIAAEAEQTERLYGFEFALRGRPLTPNQIDELLRTSMNLAERRAVWEASKAVGPVVKPGLVRLRDLHNQVVRALGYPDFFAYQVSDYGMSTPEMLALCDTLVVQLRPLYRELHTWARYELARRYRQPVPDLIPAHWLPNRYAQDWSALVAVEGLNADSALRSHTPEWVARQGEAFYRSLGFDSLPPTFWQRSSLYPVAADAGFKKNTHASAWHMDLDRDVRSLMSVEPNRDWYATVHHELGHVYYFMAYSSPAVPLVLRDGANRAYHEGVGSLIELATAQRGYLAGRGLVARDARVDQIQSLLQEALNYAVFIPFSAGTMTRFEKMLYADTLAPDRFNQAWWDLVRRYQGVEPPAPRDETFADAVTKTHVNDDPAQYYDYALSHALLFQLQDHIARTILQQDPHDTDYFGSTATGAFLRNLMAPGSSRPWRDVLRETTGRSLDAQAMVAYFQPLYTWLQQQNRGRRATLPDL